MYFDIFRCISTYYDIFQYDLRQRAGYYDVLQRATYVCQGCAIFRHAADRGRMDWRALICNGMRGGIAVFVELIFQGACWLVTVRERSEVRVTVGSGFAGARVSAQVCAGPCRSARVRGRARWRMHRRARMILRCCTCVRVLIVLTCESCLCLACGKSRELVRFCERV